MNNEFKISAILSIFRSSFIFFGALGSSIIGWVLVNTPPSTLGAAAWFGGGFFCSLSIVSLVVYSIMVVRL